MECHYLTYSINSDYFLWKCLQFPKGVFQGLLQLPAAACSDPALPDHSFPGSHHMVCLHWSWLLCRTHLSAEFHQHHPGHQPGLHHCITRSVDLCLAGLHGQCRSGSWVPCSVQVASAIKQLCVGCSQALFMYSSVLPLPLQDHGCVREDPPEDHCVRHAQVLSDIHCGPLHLCWFLLSGPASWGVCQHVNWGHHVRLAGVSAADPVSYACDVYQFNHCQSINISINR